MIATGGPRNSRPGTLNHLFFNAVDRYQKPDALQVKVSGRYEPISHTTLFARVRHAAIGLAELGVRHGDRVALLSENRPEWAIADYACLASGVTDVPIYPNETPEAAAYIIRDSGAVARVRVHGRAGGQDRRDPRTSVRGCKHVIGFSDVREPGVDHTLLELEARGAAVLTPAREDEYRARRAGGGAGPSGDDHLHVGNDGQAQGRDADARQPLFERDGVEGGDPVQRRRRVPELPAAVARVRADGRPLPDDGRRARRSRTPSRSTRCRST